ncbi:MAG: protein-L-isoaspartate(D-aspartate) O-methyltransferase [Candidatus Heimdallarchaeota archaeon]
MSHLTKNRFEEEKKRLLDRYKRAKYVQSELAAAAFLKVPRELFLPESQIPWAYSDRPLPLMSTGQTISAPHMTVMILEYLDLKPGLKILEVGAGSGYQAALIAAVVAPPKFPHPGHVYSIEIVSDLVAFARNNLKEAGFGNLVTVIEGDGTLGYPEKAPYDRIILTAAGPRVPPPLLSQLRIGGLLVMPLGIPGLWQQMKSFLKVSDTETTEQTLSSVAFVPLRGKHGV